MKILYIHQHFSTPKGAAGTRSYTFAKALIEKGHEVTMLCGSHALSQTGLTGPVHKGIRQGVVDGIRIIEIVIPYSNHDGFIKRSLKFLQFAWRALNVVFKEKFDLLFATSTPLTVAIPGILLKWFKPQKTFILEIRDLWPELPKAMGVIKNPVVLFMVSCLERRAYHAADALVGLSSGIVQGIKKIVPAKPVALIPNGCDLGFFAVDKKPLSIVGIQPSDFVVTFTGAHGLANGLEAVLDVAKVLKDRGTTIPSIKFLFIGDGKCKPALVARAQAESLTNCIFLPSMPKEQLRDVLTGVDLGLMILANVPAFYYGTSPNKFFDYIAAGLPVLNNYPGWLADLIQENQCGVVVPPAEPNKFADSLIRLVASPDQLQLMAQQAKQLALQFDRIELAKQWVAFLEKTYANSKETEINISEPRPQ